MAHITARAASATVLYALGAGSGGRCVEGEAGPRAGVPKGGVEKRISAEKRAYVRDFRSAGLGITEGCRLMGIARSTYYDRSPAGLDDTALAEAIAGICGEF